MFPIKWNLIIHLSDINWRAKSPKFYFLNGRIKLSSRYIKTDVNKVDLGRYLYRNQNSFGVTFFPYLTPTNNNNLYMSKFKFFKRILPFYYCFCFSYIHPMWDPVNTAHRNCHMSFARICYHKRHDIAKLWSQKRSQKAKSFSAQKPPNKDYF